MTTYSTENETHWNLAARFLLVLSLVLAGKSHHLDFQGLVTDLETPSYRHEELQFTPAGMTS